MTIQSTIKQCGSCKRTLPTTLFSPNWRNRDGLNNYCYCCINQGRKIRFLKKNPLPKQVNPSGPKPKDDMDPTQYLWNLKNHNLMKIREAELTRLFRYPSYPYKKIIKLYHVDTNEPHLVRIFLRSEDSVEVMIYDPKDKVIKGLIYGHGYNDSVRAQIVEELGKLALRCMWGE